MRSRARVVGSVCAAGLLLGACATPGYDAPRLQRQLERAGVAPPVARCVTDRVEKTFRLRELGLHVDPTANDLDAMRAILEACGVSQTPPR